MRPLRAIPPSRYARSRARRGFSLLELIVAVTVLTIAAGAITSTLVVSTSLTHINRETTLAVEAAQSAVESLRAVGFDEAFARYNASPDDDPAGTAPGASFDVAGLFARAGDPDGRVGSIQFPGDGFVLREDLEDRELGMPRDLDGDGAVDALDHADDYGILPVRVRIEWTGEQGARSFELYTVLVAES